MIDLLNTIEAVLAGLFGTTTFDDPTGAPRTMRYFVGSFPPKRETPGQGEDFPYRLTRINGFDLTREGVRYHPRVTIGLYTSGDTDIGMALISTTLAAIKELPAQVFAPFKLVGEITGGISTEKQHPYYEITLDMIFRGHN
jgi:hypothetical protein